MFHCFQFDEGERRFPDDLRLLNAPVEPDFYYYMADDNTVRGCNWHGTFADFAHAAAGNCFRTEAEVLRYLPQLAEQLKARYRAERGLAAPEEAGPADELSLFDELPHD